ncbi:hypothetical protein [Aeromonas veronii]|uniref:Uncharacterized protein n=1 Tax=Aeromonas veronii TaxID=654 RepID=A0A4S5CHJ6_AERVE|nr:hypothetical protein [Aeromonas veronii]THJ43715.1 hypothetical protein E8Q35_15535 [Aeromonas veronii]
MGFATKKDAENWANEYLEKADIAGHYVDPICAGTVEIVKGRRSWTFPGGDDWIDKVEVLRETQAKTA